MAKLKKGIFGPLSGKIGPLIGATWMDIPYVRGEPEKKDNPAPRSTSQIENEQKMKFTNIVLMPFHPYIEVGFRLLAIRKTPLSAAYSHNFHHAVTGVYPDLGVDYSKMMISKGKHPGLFNPVMELTAADTLKIDWEDHPDPKASFNDLVMLVVYAPAIHLSDGFIGGVRRVAKTTVFSFDERMMGEELEVYIGVISSNGKKVADSVYMGRITP